MFRTDIALLLFYLRDASNLKIARKECQAAVLGMTTFTTGTVGEPSNEGSCRSCGRMWKANDPNYSGDVNKTCTHTG